SARPDVPASTRSAADPYHAPQPACCASISVAGATAAPNIATLLSATPRGPSSPPPSPGCTAAPPSLSHGRWWVEVSAVAGASWRGATRSCDRPETAPPDPASLLRPGTACSPGALSPPPADGCRG